MIMNLIKLCFVAVLASSLLTGCSSSEDSKAKYFERAQALFEEGDYEKARVTYKNVLKIDPQDVPALIGLGETLAKLKDWRGALSYYRAANEAEPENRLAKIKLAQIYLLANVTDKASDLVEALIEVDANDTEALVIKAGILSKNKALDQAIELAERIYELDASKDEHLVLLASLLSAKGKHNKALSMLEKAATENTDSTALQIALTRIYTISKKFDLAESSYMKLIALEPGNLEIKKSLALFYEKLGRSDDAEKVLYDILSDTGLEEKTRVASVLALHDLFVSRRNLEAAIDLLNEQILVFPKAYELQFKLAADYQIQVAGMHDKDKNHRLVEAKNILSELIKVDEAGIGLQAKSRLAELEAAKGNRAEAERLISEVLEEHPGHIEALTLRGGLSLKKGEFENAIGDLRSVFNAKPNSAKVSALLGNAHLMNGELDLAIEMFENAVKHESNTAVYRLDLANLYLKSANYDKAEEQLISVQTLLPQQPLVLERLIQVYLAKNDVAQANNLVKKLIKVSPENARTYYYAGLIAQAQNKHREAIEFLDQALSLQPGATEPMSLKVKSLIALKALDEAESWLTEITSQLKDNAIAYNLKGEVLMANNKVDLAHDAFTQAIDVQPDWWVPYRNKALVARLSKNDDLAVKELEAGLASIKDSVGEKNLRVSLANLAEQKGDVKKAVTQYEALIKNNTEDFALTNNLAMLLAEYAGGDQKLLQRASELASTLEQSREPLMQDTVGWVKYANGKFEDAIPFFKSALAKYPDNPEIHYHIGMTYKALKNTAKAKQHLSIAAKSEASFKGKEKAVTALQALSNEG